MLYMYYIERQWQITKEIVRLEKMLEASKNHRSLDFPEGQQNIELRIKELLQTHADIDAKIEEERAADAKHLEELSAIYQSGLSAKESWKEASETSGIEIFVGLGIVAIGVLIAILSAFCK